MDELFGDRRRRLLRHLLRNKAGASVDELVQALGVTRTAVRQHLAALMRDGLVEPGAERETGGRPVRLHVLTEAGREVFPRRYSWFARLLVEAIAQEHGTAGLRTRLGRIAATVVAQLPAPAPALTGASGHDKVEDLSTLMDQLGYDARKVRDVGGAPTIEADNCVFHALAMQNSAVCQFDLALMTSYTGKKVELHECMAKGGHVCRFRFLPRDASARDA
jgi:predicted ArsR family transcriptional regulator